MCGQGAGGRQEEKTERAIKQLQQRPGVHDDREYRVKGISLQYFREVESMGLADRFSERSEGKEQLV